MPRALEPGKKYRQPAKKKPSRWSPEEQRRRVEEWRKANPHATLTPEFFSPAGRKSLYQPDLHCNLLFEHLSTGHTISSFGSVAKVSKQTVFDWLTHHEDFCRARELGEMAREHLTEKIGLQQAVTGKGNYQAWAMFAFQYLKWVPPSQSHVISGNGVPIGFENFDKMTPEEKRSRMEELIEEHKKDLLPKSLSLTDEAPKSGT